jgi:uncharacterized MAPEG superfamily protein
MNIFAGSIEIQMLCWSVVLGLVQLILATAFETKDQGRAWNISSRDGTPPPVSALTGRLKRAFNNFRETFAFFAVAVLAITFLEKTSAASAWGAQIYFWARLVYVPVYAAGIIGVRTAIWTVSMVGLVMVLLAALA